MSSTKKEELWEPDPEDVRIWHEFLSRPKPPKPPPKRKRKKRKKRYDFSKAPSRRGYRSIIVRRDTYEMLAEMRKFYGVGFSSILYGIVKSAFDKTYRHAEVLARIKARKEREDGIKDRP